MSALSRWARALTLMAGCAWFAAGCVRVDEPDQFLCNTNSDCEASEKCLRTSTNDLRLVCVGREYCRDSGDCESGKEFCDNQKCVPMQCSRDDLSRCPPHSACVDYVCSNACFEDGDCGSTAHCSQSRCVDGPRRGAFGSKCTQPSDCESDICCQRDTGSVCALSCSVAGTACVSALECQDPYCCEQGSAKVCSKTSCSATPCKTDGDCPKSWICNAQKQCELPFTETGMAANGAPCQLDADCKSSSCVTGTCRGTGVTGDECMTSADCRVRRQCCPSEGQAGACSDVDVECAGVVGASCTSDADCLNGNTCYKATFCTKACSASSECGKSPWGTANTCDQDADAKKMCFPSCTETNDCLDHVPGTYCVSGTMTGSKICRAF